MLSRSPVSEASYVASLRSVNHMRSESLESFSNILQTHPVNLPLHQPVPVWIPYKAAADQDAHEDNAESADDVGEPPTLMTECYQLIAIAGPLFVEGVAAIGEQLVATGCVGRLPDPAALAALVLAQAVYNVSGYSIVSGLASALETLCGQAFGAGNHHMLSVVLVRAQFVCLLSILPTVLVWATGSLAQVLPMTGQDPAIAIPTSRLLQLMVPSLLLSVFSETVAQYLLAQGEALPGMVSSLIGLALCPLYNWGLVYGLGGWQGLGLPGAALAAVAIQGTLVLLLLSYMLYRDCWHDSWASGSWRGFRLVEAVQGWGSYMKYGLPCVMMVCLEWWVWEVLVLMSGLLPDAETSVAVMGLSTQLSLLPWMFCYSLGTATATRVAQALGGGSATRAAKISKLACLMVLLCSVVLCAGVWCLRDPLVASLTHNSTIQQQLKHLLPVVVAAIICDGQVAVLSGMLRAAGRQGIGAVINWGSYWVLGLPVSWLLGFKANMGVMGLRLGLTVAAACQALVLHLLVAFRFDWEEEVQRAKDLVEAHAVDGELTQDAADLLDGFDSPQTVRHTNTGPGMSMNEAADGDGLLESLLQSRQHV